MSTYAIVNVHSVDFGPAIVEYLEKIDATLEPFGGRFLVHGGAFETFEGSWGPVGAIVIEFPSLEAAHGWYDSPLYREILRLRTDNMVADAIFAEGEASGYLAADSLKKLDAA